MTIKKNCLLNAHKLQKNGLKAANERPGCLNHKTGYLFLTNKTFIGASRYFKGG